MGNLCGMDRVTDNFYLSEFKEYNLKNVKTVFNKRINLDNFFSYRETNNNYSIFTFENIRLKDNSVYSGQLRLLNKDEKLDYDFIDRDNKKYVLHRYGNQKNYENTIIYNGEYSGGLPNGYGEIIIKGQSYSNIKGVFVNNVFHGKFLEIGKDYRYEGDYKYGLKNGYGKLNNFKNNIFTYTGDFIDNLFNGRGEIVYESGAKYTGDFKNNKFHGKGILINNQYKYKGNFRNGLKEGHGILEYHQGNNEKLEGYWKQDKFQS